MNSVQAFFASYVFTLLAGIAMTESIGARTSFLPLSIILALAFAAQNYVFGQKFMRQDRHLRPDFKTRKGFFLRGLLVDPQLPEKEESEFLAHTQSLKTTLIIRLGYIGLTMLLFYIYKKLGGFSIQLSTVLHVLAILLVLPVATPAHLFAPLLFNSLAAVTSLLRENPPHPGFTVAYIFLLFATLSFHQHQDRIWSFSDKAAPSEKTASLVQVAKAGAMFLFILIAVNWIFPRQNPFDDPTYKTLQRLNQRVPKVNIPGSNGMSQSSNQQEPGSAGGQGGARRPGGGTGQNTGTGSSGSNGASGGGGGSQAGEQNFNGNSNADPSEAGSSKTKREVELLKQRIAQLQKEAENHPDPASKARLENFIKQADQQLKQTEVNQALTDEQLQQKLQNLKSASENPPSTAARQELQSEMANLYREINNRAEDAKLKAAQNQTGQGGQSGDSQSAGPNGSNGLAPGAGGQPVGAGPKSGNGPSVAGRDGHGEHARSNAELPPEKKEYISEAMLKKLFTVLKFLGIALAVILGAVYLLKLHKKEETEEEKVNAQKAEEAKRQVRRELAKLKEAKLTARQEVLKKYHLFLRLMAAAEHGKEDHTPPTRYARDVSGVFPKLEGEFEYINRTFCATLYGDHEVAPEILKAYNSSINAVFSSIR